MTAFLRAIFSRPAPAARPSYAHHIHSVTDLRTGETTSQRVQVTSRDTRGRIRTTRTVGV
jgi:hypothetical protein